MDKNKVVTAMEAIGIVGLAGYLAKKKHKNLARHKDKNNGGKRALQLASVASMIDQFTIPNIEILQSIGCRVDVVADFTNPGTITAERCEDLKERLKTMGVRCFNIPIPRSLNPILMIRSYNQVKCLLERENYNLLHCHSPIGGVIARQAAKNKRKDGLRVIYTAHGFHFFDGAPVRNWLLYYPIEKWMSRYTDVLITINGEDYKRASKRFHARKTIYIPGVGVDIGKFSDGKGEVAEKRKELGIGSESIMLLSVGELNINKNHKVIVKAIGKFKKSDEKYADRLHYFIAGKGVLRNELMELAERLGVNLHILGFRDDVPELLAAADIFVLPSIREGLNVSLMEGMAARKPCIVSKIRGNTDLIIEGKGGLVFDSKNEDDFKNKLGSLIKMSETERCCLGEYNFRKIQKFSDKVVSGKMRNIYESVI